MPNGFDLDEFLKLQDPSSFRMMGVTDEAEPNPDMPIPAAPMPMRSPAVAANPAATPSLSPSAGIAPTREDDIVTPYIMQKYGIPEKKKFNLGEYSDENRKKLAGEAEAGPGIGTKLAAAAAALGQGLMGGNAAGAGMGILNADAQERQKKLDQFDKGRSNLIQEHTLDRMADKEGREDADLASAMDPNSAVSMSFQSLASKIDPKGDWKNKSAYDIQKTYPQLEKIYGIDQKRLERLDNRAFQEKLFGLKQDEKNQIREDRAALQARPDDKQIQAFTDFDTAESDLNNLLEQLGENSGWVGPADGRVPDLLVGDDQVAFRSAVGKYKDAYRKAITGAGAGPREIQMLEKRLPSETDSLANFKAKAIEAKKTAQRMRELYAQNLQKGGKDVSRFMQTHDAGAQRDDTAPQTKVVGGKTYRKVQGGWEEM